MLICSPKYLVLTFAILLLIVIDLKGQLINNNDIGYIEDYQKLPRINFVKSDAVEYEQCKSLNQFIIPKIKQSKTNFILQTNTGQIKFKKTLPDKKILMDMNSLDTILSLICMRSQRISCLMN